MNSSISSNNNSRWINTTGPTKLKVISHTSKSRRKPTLLVLARGVALLETVAAAHKATPMVWQAIVNLMLTPTLVACHKTGSRDHPLLEASTPSLCIVRKNARWILCSNRTTTTCLSIRWLRRCGRSRMFQSWCLMEGPRWWHTHPRPSAVNRLRTERVRSREGRSRRLIQPGETRKQQIRQQIMVTASSRSRFESIWTWVKTHSQFDSKAPTRCIISKSPRLGPTLSLHDPVLAPKLSRLTSTNAAASIRVTVLKIIARV